MARPPKQPLPAKIPSPSTPTLGNTPRSQGRPPGVKAPTPAKVAPNVQVAAPTRKSGGQSKTMANKVADAMRSGKPLDGHAELWARMLNDLAGSGLSEEHALTMRCRPVDRAEAALLKLPAEAEGYALPYFDLDNKLSTFFRVRYLEDTRKGFDALSGKKALRYGQVANTVNDVYLPPFCDWAEVAADVEYALIITEGEKKAAAATLAGLPTIGLGGVWCFQSAKAGAALLPRLEEFAWEGRCVYIVFDSDSLTNPDVLAAEGRLAQRLIERGAQVLIGRLPAQDDVKKVGLDDYLMLHGLDALQTRVLEPAFEYSESEVLHDLNKQVIYVRDPGILFERETFQRMRASDFVGHAYSNVHYWETRQTATGPQLVKKPAAPAWLAWEHRAECAGVIFAPGKLRITDDGLLNTWRGWGVTPRKGSVEGWRWLLGHLFGDNVESRTWFERWCAYPLQHPGTKMYTAVLLWGRVHGSGKTLVGHTLMKLYGRHHSDEIKDSDLDNVRNEWAENKQFVLADDIVARGDRKFMRQLMTMITQQYIRLDPKYIPSYRLPDLINYLFTSNEPDAFYMDDDDRRFYIHEVLAERMTLAERDAFLKWRNAPGGLEALFHHLLSLPLGDFDPHAPAPETAAKREMNEIGKSELGAWVRELRDSTDALLHRAGLRGDLVSAQELLAVYDPAGDKRTSVNALARELKRSGFEAPATGSKLRLPDGRLRAVYVVRNAEFWRKATWKHACDHYNETSPAARELARGKKF